MGRSFLHLIRLSCFLIGLFTFSSAHAGLMNVLRGPKEFGDGVVDMGTALCDQFDEDCEKDSGEAWRGKPHLDRCEFALEYRNFATPCVVVHPESSIYEKYQQCTLYDILNAAAGHENAGEIPPGSCALDSEHRMILFQTTGVPTDDLTKPAAEIIETGRQRVFTIQNTIEVDVPAGVTLIIAGYKPLWVGKRYTDNPCLANGHEVMCDDHIAERGLAGDWVSGLIADDFSFEHHLNPLSAAHWDQHHFSSVLSGSVTDIEVNISAAESPWAFKFTGKGTVIFRDMRFTIKRGALMHLEGEVTVTFNQVYVYANSVRASGWDVEEGAFTGDIPYFFDIASANATLDFSEKGPYDLVLCPKAMTREERERSHDAPCRDSASSRAVATYFYYRYGPAVPPLDFEGVLMYPLAGQPMLLGGEPVGFRMRPEPCQRLGARPGSPEECRVIAAETAFMFKASSSGYEPPRRVGRDYLRFNKRGDHVEKRGLIVPAGLDGSKVYVDGRPIRLEEKPCPDGSEPQWDQTNPDGVCPAPEGSGVAGFQRVDWSYTCPDGKYFNPRIGKCALFCGMDTGRVVSDDGESCGCPDGLLPAREIHTEVIRTADNSVETVDRLIDICLPRCDHSRGDCGCGFSEELWVDRQGVKECRPKCTEDQNRTAATGTCECNSGLEFYQGVCVEPCAEGSGLIHEGDEGICGCPEGLELRDGVCQCPVGLTLQDSECRLIETPVAQEDNTPATPSDPAVYQSRKEADPIDTGDDEETEFAAETPGGSGCQLTVGGSPKSTVFFWILVAGGLAWFKNCLRTPDGRARFHA